MADRMRSKGLETLRLLCGLCPVHFHLGGDKTGHGLRGNGGVVVQHDRGEGERVHLRTIPEALTAV